MIIVRNKYIPLKPFKAITILKWILVRRDGRFTDVDLRHEGIHWEQEKEMCVIGFYVWYVMEFLIRLTVYRNWMQAYKMISLEQEAYQQQRLTSYRDERKKYSWTKYLKIWK